MKARRGQVALYLAAILVAVCILALMNVDTFTATRAKWKVQDGGDAAALAAARRQGEVLNEIGRLNIDHIVASLRNDKRECDRIVERQRRLALLGPVKALGDSSAAAEANGIEKNPDFSKILMDHARVVRMVYAGRGGDVEPFPEPFDGAWDEYATEIEIAASAGLAAGADNMRFYCSPPAGHKLLERQFYNAINGRDWCWFHFNCEPLLNNYTDWTDWEPISDERDNQIGGSEIYPLFLQPRDTPLTQVLSTQEIARVVRAYNGRGVSAEDFERSWLIDADQTWFFLGNEWGEWFDGYRLAGEAAEFPVVGSAKPEYNVRGCAAVCRCMKDQQSMTSGAASTYVWAAAAKPFGTVSGENGSDEPATAFKRFLVPCFNAVRLVPLDSVDGSSLRTADVEWVVHIRDHLPKYLSAGPDRLSSSCQYCAALKMWEKPVFRQRGITWLEFNSGQCVRPAPCGTLPGGGTSYGH